MTEAQLTQTNIPRGTIALYCSLATMDTATQQRSLRIPFLSILFLLFQASGLQTCLTFPPLPWPAQWRTQQWQYLAVADFWSSLGFWLIPWICFPCWLPLLCHCVLVIGGDNSQLFCPAVSVMQLKTFSYTSCSEENRVIIRDAMVPLSTVVMQHITTF